METAPIKTKLHTTALGYARYGFPIFPLAPPSKKPLAGSHGFEDATSDLKAIETWWSQNPECNIGLSLGPAKRLLLDLDYRHSPTIQNRSDFVERYGPIPDNACEAISGSGGRHVYFDFEGQVPAELEPGVELKCQGSYSVLPPSIHPDSGRPYVFDGLVGWKALLEPAVPPQWLLEAIARRVADKKTTSPDPEEPLREGERNIRLTKFAGKLRRARLIQFLIQLRGLNISVREEGKPLSPLKCSGANGET